MNTFDAPPARASSQGSWLSKILPVVAIFAVVGLGGAFYVMRYQPLEQSHHSLVDRYNEKAQAYDKLAAAHSALESKQQVMATEKRQLEEELARTAAEREAALAELQKMQDDLSSALEEEIAEGNVLIERRGDDLVVDVADKILFAKGEAEVSERGQTLLVQVAETMRALPKYVLQVGGHTDSAPITSPKVKEKYPTNWELSTARATQVVRFLQDEGKIPGGRLVATGFAEFRPTASNRTRKGQQRNRRIEIVLLRTTDDG